MENHLPQKLTEKQVSDFKEAFFMYDKKGNGTVNTRKFGAGT